MKGKERRETFSVRTWRHGTTFQPSTSVGRGHACLLFPLLPSLLFLFLFAGLLFSSSTRSLANQHKRVTLAHKAGVVGWFCAKCVCVCGDEKLLVRVFPMYDESRKGKPMFAEQNNVEMRILRQGCCEASEI